LSGALQSIPLTALAETKQSCQQLIEAFKELNIVAEPGH
jgi:hypothetical protein